jgi:hypothetical protein
MSSTPTIIVHLDHLVLTDRQGATLVVRGKWFTLYRELFLSPSARLDRDSVSTLPGWTGTGDDIGRELARHLRRSKACQLDPPPILSRQPTIRWERNPFWSVAVSPDSRESHVAESSRREWLPTISAGTEVTTVRWAAMQTRALLAFMEGTLKSAVKNALAAAELAHCPDLRAASQLLALRAAWRLDPDDATLDLVEDLEDAVSTLGPSTPVGPLRAAVLARYAAFKTLHATADEWPAVIRSLNNSLTTQRQGNDLLTDALTANYAAVAQRRSGRVGDAFTMIAKALAAGVTSGDIHFIQSALFNCGHIMLTLGETPDTAGLVEDAITVLELVSTVTERHNIGGDSAQNELLIADHKISQSKFDDAERMIARARSLVALSGNVYDQACLGEVELRLALKRNASLTGSAVFRQRLGDVANLYVLANREDLAVAVRRAFGNG